MADDGSVWMPAVPEDAYAMSVGLALPEQSFPAGLYVTTPKAYHAPE